MLAREREPSHGTYQRTMSKESFMEIFAFPKKALPHWMGDNMRERLAHTTFVHHRKEACEGGGRDEDSPATIYLILVVMATQPEARALGR